MRKSLAWTGWIAALALFGATNSYAKSPNSAPDAASEDALMKTMELLTTPALRGDALAKDPKAKMVDSQVDALVRNPALKEEIYRLSAEIFSDLMRSSGGDVQAMVEKLQKAKDNPKAFAEGLSEKNRAALKELARKIQDSPVAGSQARPAK